MRLPMILLAPLLVVALLTRAGRADADDDPVAALDKKITKNLARDTWNDASKVFVRALWDDFKTLYATPIADVPARPGAKAPRRAAAHDYVGQYGRRGSDRMLI